MKNLILPLSIMVISTPAHAEGPQSAVETLAAAMADGDRAAVEAAFTEDAGYSYSLEGDLTRGTGFDTWVQSDITGPGSIFIIESATVEGNQVDALVRWGRGGTASTPARYVFVVEGGLIDAWRMTGR
jgi:uncharacterized protein YdeI (BOF family)